MVQSEFIRQYLPKNYHYSCFKREVNGRISFRVKSICTKENCIKWLKEFGDEQFVTWQILTTFPRAGRVNLYKSVWRCQHNVYPKAAVTSCKSKHTECPAKITIFLKRYLKSSRSKDPKYQLNKDWPCVIELEPLHNHPRILFEEATGNEISQEWLKWKHDPEELPHNNEREKKKIEEATGNDISQEWLEWSHDLEELSHNNEREEEENMLDPLRINDENDKNIEPDYNNIEDDLKELDLLIERIKTGIVNNPEIFQPALKSMMENVKKYLTADSDLLSAMHSFGKHIGVQNKHYNNKKGLRHQLKVGVQPISVERRRYATLGGKRARTVGQPIDACNPLKYLGHDYTSFNNIPSKRRTLPHDLTHYADE